MRRALAFAIILVTAIATALADDKGRACLTSAFDAHNQATLKLLETAGPVMSPEAQVMRRRLDEKYCFDVTACTLLDRSGEATAIMSSAAFSSCLKEVSQ